MNTSAPPWSVFDADWYYRTYSALLEATGVQAPEQCRDFYNEVGVQLRHSPNPFFDEDWYIRSYPLVAAAVEQGQFASGFAHYIVEGCRTLSPHWLFAEPLYLAENTDLTRRRLDELGCVNGYDHFLRIGDAELRRGHWLCDPSMAAATLPPDSPKNEKGPFARFVTQSRWPIPDPALSWYFDPVWYFGQYPSVRAEVEAGFWSSALEHYLCNDTPSEFDPNEHFSEVFYRSIHVDIAPALADGRFRNCYDHFLRYGAIERRKPHPLVNLRDYARTVSVQADVEYGLLRDVFAHFRSTRGGALTGNDSPSLPTEEECQEAYARHCESLLPALARFPLDFTCDAPELSVIIVACNRFAFTMAALASLRSNCPGQLQLILVDSGSRDEVAHIERFVHGADVIRFRQNVGFVDACNAALARVRADATLFMNNDVLLDPGAVGFALRRLWQQPDTGAVGGKIIRLHGLLQEAGSIIWRDGSVTGYLRDRDPNLPEANFVREVDFCSGVFLMVRTEILRRLDGFDPDYSPAYFEEADLCARMAIGGHKVVYDPAVVVRHHEFGTTDPTVSARLIDRNLPTFRRKNRNYLRRRPLNSQSAITMARSSRNERCRILFVDDRVPLRHLGTGFTRSNDIVRTMAELGHYVTVFPIYRPIEPVATIYADFPDTVEVIHDRDLPDLPVFLDDRREYYDRVWLARTHNAPRFLDALARCPSMSVTGRMILDTEAVAATRSALMRRLSGAAEEDVAAAVATELQPAFMFQHVVAVNGLDAAAIAQSGLAEVSILGHRQDPRPTPRPWADRSGLLFVGAIPEPASPNLDALTWFSSAVLPLLDATLPDTVEFTVVGTLGRTVELSILGRNRRVRLLGAVGDLQPLYDEHRVFVAPTRFAGGIPYKLHEAASYGLPIVAASLLADQLGWTSGVDLLAGATDDPQGFADQILALYGDEALWNTLRANALGRIRTECNSQFYRDRVSEILFNDWGY